MESVCNGVPISVADHLVCNGAKFHCDDIVVCGARLGYIIACHEKSNGVLETLVELLRAIHTPSCFVRTAQRELWPASELRAAIAWMSSEFPGVLRILW